MSNTTVLSELRGRSQSKRRPDFTDNFSSAITYRKKRIARNCLKRFISKYCELAQRFYYDRWTCPVVIPILDFESQPQTAWPFPTWNNTRGVDPFSAYFRH